MPIMALLIVKAGQIVNINITLKIIGSLYAKMSLHKRGI